MTHPAPALGTPPAGFPIPHQGLEKCAWIPAPIEALIIACLSRLFARLEHLLVLWRTGQLLPPMPSNPTQRAIAPTGAIPHAAPLGARHTCAARQRRSTPGLRRVVSNSRCRPAHPGGALRSPCGTTRGLPPRTAARDPPV